MSRYSFSSTYMNPKLNTNQKIHNRYTKNREKETQVSSISGAGQTGKLHVKE